MNRKVKYINWKSQKGKGKNDKQKYSVFSDIAYKKGKAERDEVLKKFDKDKNWSIDHSLSNRDVVVLKSNKTDEVVVSVRGTDLNSKDSKWRDLRSDAGIAFGVSKHGKRNSEVSSVVEKAMGKYKSKPTLTGHSLGARMAADIAQKKGLRGVVYNMGSSPLDVFNRRSANNTHFNVRSDLISVSKNVRN